MLPVISPFSSDWITFSIFLTAIFGLIGLSEFARVRLAWPPEVSRKFVHILVGLFVLASPFLFSTNRPPVLLAIIFIAVNLLALRSAAFKGMHTTERKTYGTVYFPIAYLILCLFWWERPITFQVALLLLTFADTATALAGENSRNPEPFRLWQDEKTVQGSLVMAITSALLTGLGTAFFRNLAGMDPFELQILIPLCLFVAATSTIAEAVSNSGSDNLSVPIVAAVTYDLYFSAAQNGEIMTLLLWILFSFALAQGAFSFRALSTDGALGAFVLGVFIFGIGGWRFVLPMGIFFIVSSLLSSIGKDAKEKHRQAIGKGSQRDVVQVYANGGVPMLLAIWWFYSPSELLYVAYLASVAAAAADTWATEIGFYTRGVPRNCVTFRTMEPGTSGGITLLGTIGALFGAGVIALSGRFLMADANALLMVVVAGFAANCFDSVLGATVQATYMCGGCNRKVEVAHHCERRTTLTSGSGLVNNDTVNLLCTMAGGGIILMMG